MSATSKRRRVIARAQRAGRGLLATLCLASALLLNLPNVRPAYVDMRDVLVAALALFGVLAVIPAIWRWRMRFPRPFVRVIAGVLAGAAWTAGAGAAMLTVLFLTSPVGFMVSRQMVFAVHSRDARVSFYAYQYSFLEPGGASELVLGFGPFELPVLRVGDGDRTFFIKLRDVRAWGHRFQWGEGQDVRIDGEPATVEWGNTGG